MKIFLHCITAPNTLTRELADQVKYEQKEFPKTRVLEYHRLEQNEALNITWDLSMEYRCELNGIDALQRDVLKPKFNTNSKF